MLRRRLPFHAICLQAGRPLREGGRGEIRSRLPTLRAFDLDFKNHDDNDRPTLDHFARLVGYLSLLDYQPNLVYQTRGGCRLIYLIEPSTDALWFETHYIALAKQLETPLINADCGYRLDMSTRDWARLFRCPRVTRDGVPEFNPQIRLFHTDRLDFDVFRIKPKPVRKVAVGNMPITARDPKLLRLLHTPLVPGNRNNAIFAALCHVYRRYDDDAAAMCVKCIHEAAINSGLDEAEFKSVHNSARKQPREE